MARFKLITKDSIVNPYFIYDSVKNELYTSDNKLITVTINDLPNMNMGLLIRISLGKQCNFSCKYCAQNHSKGGNVLPKPDIDKFVINLVSYINKLNKPVQAISLWGGEGFLYFSYIKEIHNKVSEHFTTGWFIQTNGSLFNDEIINWCLTNNIHVGLSWDGISQHIRGLDPLKDSKLLTYCKQLYHCGLLSFTPVFTSENTSYTTYIDSLREIFEGDEIAIFEGTPLIVYDDIGLKYHMSNKQLQMYSDDIYYGLTKGELSSCKNLINKAIHFCSSLNKPITFKHQCYYSSTFSFDTDLYGNILSCINNSCNEVDRYGNSHTIGHITINDTIPVGTNTVLMNRYTSKCKDCIVFPLCKSGCPFIDDKYLASNCESWYYYNIAILKHAVNLITDEYITDVCLEGE